MDLRLYELTLVLDPQLEQNQIDEIIQKTESIIIDSNGEIHKKELWGKRRLAYEINNKQYGYYAYLLFKSAGELIEKIERDFKLNESVLRFLTIRLSKAAIRQMEKEQKPSKKSQTQNAKKVTEIEENVEETIDEQTDE